ncbi:cobalamin-dependent protein [Methanobrevibacter curvatus]|uniref:B12 binding domain protein n=1 Tax=Methanobrevibacter curvatus TaxID=49547 RepID=A0A166CB90_9EURY|nr:cobalamin-dependent protein [Methanobrevibacter curvatus]KZX12817.1 B12 binding domain protein [Methanobrevibacter curvatus]
MNKCKVKKALLVEPNFPIANKSRNHQDFLPIGLLKIASYLKTLDIEVKLIRYDEDLITETQNFKPDITFVTSLFTYWSSFVKETVEYCKHNFDVPIVVGGIYASLMPEDCKQNTGCDYVQCGVIDEAEKLIPDYDLVNVDYQIIHTTRGCIRRCEACGVYEIEPKFTSKKSIKDEIIKKKIIFYDNNLLANRYIKNVLNELIELKKSRTISYCESQSGFDGRILEKKPFLGKLLKEAGFKNPKIAWDGPLSDKNEIKKQLDILVASGYKESEISVFVLYNFDINYEEMEKKRVEAWKFGVQISDCRYRPLDSILDNYNSHKRKSQSNKDYYIHPKWSDEEIRLYRRNIRSHNICIRLGTKYYSRKSENKKIPLDIAKKYRSSDYESAKKYIKDAWNPAEFHKIIKTV